MIFIIVFLLSFKNIEADITKTRKPLLKGTRGPLTASPTTKSVWILGSVKWSVLKVEIVTNFDPTDPYLSVAYFSAKW